MCPVTVRIDHSFTCESRIARFAGLLAEQVLKYFQSDINTYPGSMQGAKRRWAVKLRLPVSSLISDLVLRRFGNLSHKSGRLYIFLAAQLGSTP